MPATTATTMPGVSAAADTPVGTSKLVRDQFERMITSAQEMIEPATAASTLLAALSPRIMRRTRDFLQPTARRIPSSLVRSTTDISIVLRTLTNDSTMTMAVMAQAVALPRRDSVAVLMN